MKYVGGFTLIEVLVTFLIISIGLLGLAALQTSTVNDQFEAYQRIQITTLLDDMATRIRTNPDEAKKLLYTLESNPIYGGSILGPCTATPGAARDLCVWNDLLAGAAATNGAAAAPLNARGCLTKVEQGTAEGKSLIRIAVAWQGITESAVPGDGCGEGLYGAESPLSFRRVAYRDVLVR